MNVLVILYNRVQQTTTLFSVLQKFRGLNIYVHCDGPVLGCDDDNIRVGLTRNLVKDSNLNVIETNELVSNMGCKDSVNMALAWFFDRVDEGIILEDDCIPTESFFHFMREMLDRYRSDKKIMSISGFSPYRGEDAKLRSRYYYSKCGYLWGWATWKDRFHLYDPCISEWAKYFLRNRRSLKFGSEEEQLYWFRNFHGAYFGKIDTWDYQWICSMAMQDKVSVVPFDNFIENIGFDALATHTTETISIPKTQELENSATFNPVPRSFSSHYDNLLHHQFGRVSSSVVDRLSNHLALFIYYLRIRLGGLR